MKTLQNHTIIYDADCPLCKAYTGAFVKTRMLDENGREAYRMQVGSGSVAIDWNRARNEIALVNKTTKSVTYGIDSLFSIIGNSLPIFNPLFRFQPFRFLIAHLYKFISFNRKVIAPGNIFEEPNSCTPDFNLSYRLAYLIITWTITSMILVLYFRLGTPILPESGYLREFLICAGPFLFQGLIVTSIRKDKLMHYLGNMMTISLAGALLLSPILLLSNLIHSPTFYVGYFIIVVFLMFLEHVRRVRIVQLPWYVSATWVGYRLLMLPLILLNIL